MEKIEHFVYRIAFVMVVMILAMVVITGLFIQASYDYADFPYFEKITIEKIMAIIIVTVFLIAYMYIGKKLHWNLYAILILYFVVSVLYLYFVQLEPFSDMKFIYDIAINNMHDEIGYLSTYSNQIPITIYLWLITKIFGISIFVPKILNLIFNVVIFFFIYKLYVLCNGKTEDAKAIVWFSALLIPPILYENHIYNDVLFTMLTIIMVYMIMQGKYTRSMLVLLSGLSIIQYLIRPCGIIYIIAMIMYMILFQREWKKGILCAVIIVMGIVGINKANEKIFQTDTSQAYPIWSFIQMGINEEEFGFQDGTHSSDWTWKDCVDKYKEMGWERVTVTLVKKEVWMWSEGTYQAQRYGFGDAWAAYNHENFITKELRDVEGSQIRNILNIITKGQYYVYMVLALIGLLSLRKQQKYSLFLYVICGMTCFYLIWEMKSRYIYSLYPLFLLFAYFGWLEMKKWGENVICHLSQKDKLIS